MTERANYWVPCSGIIELLSALIASPELYYNFYFHSILIYCDDRGTIVLVFEKKKKASEFFFYIHGHISNSWTVTVPTYCSWKSWGIFINRYLGKIERKFLRFIFCNLLLMVPRIFNLFLIYLTIYHISLFITT